ncbi:MAG: alkaline phosphatase [Aquirufa sp.]|jgi:alkaline phosphatase
MKKIILFCFFSISLFAQNKPKNILFLVGDGMGVSQIYAGLTANKGHLNLEQFKVIGFHRNQASDNYVTDSAAGATAFATGKQTYNGAIGLDSLKQPSISLLELAEQKGLSTGLVSTCDITDATPASFIAHQFKRAMHEEIATDFLKTDVDVVIGGGRKYFEARQDKQNLLDTLRKKNYAVLGDIASMESIHRGKLINLYAAENPVKMSEGRGDALLKSTQKAIELLSQNNKGFFALIEGSQIDWGGHANDAPYAIAEMIDFDKSIGYVLEFARKNKETLVIVTADHETGGMALMGGDMKTGEVKAAFTTKGHTGQMIPVFAFGPGAENFAGIYHNYDLFTKMRDALHLGQK